ncbi:MAG: Hsp20/alpha crystallin family protein [Thaumarchaeota archaeon]|nr:Hsp20/alpha crystallin family protein [Nitrososphaerota archaeon]MDG6906790.1 Hsp20/alpha crystallin family protein [Nitrososphaerota archaeon]
MSDDWWEDWIKARRRRRPSSWDSFGYPEDFLRDLDRQLEDEFNWISKHVPKDLVRERTTKEGVTKEFGPFVYGYSVTIGPDGKPVIREFGNMKPGGPSGRPAMQLKSEREPVVDVIDLENQIKVVAELPGVRKEDISLNLNERTLTIRVDTEKHKYYKELELPAEVVASSAGATCTNGILEVTLEKKAKETQTKGTQVKVE